MTNQNKKAEHIGIPLKKTLNIKFETYRLSP